MTAVEFIEDKIKNMIYNGADFGEDLPALLSHIEQAKEMEKDLISDAWNDGNFLGRNGNILANYDKGEQYYKQTYK